jgi:hypothetical protein
MANQSSSLGHGNPRYRSEVNGASRDCLKTKVSEEGAFVITGFAPREPVAVAEPKDGMLVPAGLVKFGLARKDLSQRLERLRAGPENRSGLVPVRPQLIAGVRYFGRYRTGASATACCCRSAERASIAECLRHAYAGNPFSAPQSPDQVWSVLIDYPSYARWNSFMREASARSVSATG